MKSLFAWLMLFFALIAQATAGVEMPNDISANVAGTTSFDRDTGLYTYRYTITNYGESSKLLHEFHIPLRGATVLNVVAPPGWEESIFDDGSLVGWCACAEEGIVVPRGYIDNGSGLPSTFFAVEPGRTLSGFSFQSPYPPSPGIFYAGAWVPVPIEGIDFPEGQEPERADFPADMLSGAVVGPLKDDRLHLGGRRPAVDGFLVVANLRDRGSYTGPVIVDILFSQNGENVLQSTFRATLNGANVTDRFSVVDANRRRAVFEAIAGSPLTLGKNTLITSVDGTVPGSNMKVTDSERVVFLAH